MIFSERKNNRISLIYNINKREILYSEQHLDFKTNLEYCWLPEVKLKKGEWENGI